MTIAKYDTFNITELKEKDIVEVCYINITPKRKYVASDVGTVCKVTDSDFTIVTNQSVTKTYNFTDAIAVSKLDAEDSRFTQKQ